MTPSSDQHWPHRVLTQQQTPDGKMALLLIAVQRQFP